MAGQPTRTRGDVHRNRAGCSAARTAGFGRILARRRTPYSRSAGAEIDSGAFSPACRSRVARFDNMAQAGAHGERSQTMIDRCPGNRPQRGSEPMKIFYGWVVVGAAMVVTCIGFGRDVLAGRVPAARLIGDRLVSHGDLDGRAAQFPVHGHRGVLLGGPVRPAGHAQGRAHRGRADRPRER